MGIAINYGTASGQVAPFPLQDLHSKSLSVCRPTLRTWIAKRSDLQWASQELFFEKSQALGKEVKDLLKEHGDTIVDDVRIEQTYGGMIS